MSLEGSGRYSAYSVLMGHESSKERTFPGVGEDEYRIISNTVTIRSS